MHENAPSVEHTDGTRARRNGQAPSLTKHAAKVAGAIFDLLDDQGTARASSRTLGEAAGCSQRLVTAAVRELEAAGYIRVTRSRTGSRFDWLTASGAPGHRAPGNPGGVPCARGAPGALNGRGSDGGETDPADRIATFRKEIGEEGCAKLDQAYADGRRMRHEFAELRRTTTPDQVRANILDLKQAITRATEPELVRARADARAAEPVVATRGGHAALTDAEYVAGCDALEQLTSRYGSNSADRRRELLALARCEPAA